jgi:deazaflavin-dependent oxidoreductase (nitroreductase family)
MMTAMHTRKYNRPSPIVSRVLNPAMGALTRIGLSMRGAHLLWTRGRRSGQWRKTPVNPMTYQGNRYLVAPRGDTHWARNLEAEPAGKLQVGRRIEDIAVELVPAEEQAPLLRAYLDRWATETAGHFGVKKDCSVEELSEIAAFHPVFRIR